MNLDEIKVMVNNILVDEFEKEAEDLKEESHLFNDLDLDSLDGIDLVVALEKALKTKLGKDIKIDEERAKKLQTVGDIYNAIDELVNK
jgi:acyl carrier protein